jgi:hypothetical protein
VRFRLVQGVARPQRSIRARTFLIHVVYLRHVRDRETTWNPVLSHWIAWGTGSFLSLLLLILDQYFGRKTPKAWFGIFLSLGILVSCFQAWPDQYRENEAGRVLRSLALERVECNIDRIDAEIQGSHPADSYTNKGGYIYSGREIALQLPFIKDTDVLPTVVGTIEYSISYHSVGGNVKHQTSKTLASHHTQGEKRTIRS